MAALLFFPAVWIVSPIADGNVARAEQRIPIGHGETSDTLILTDGRTWAMRQPTGSFWQFSDPEGLFSVSIPEDWSEAQPREAYTRLAIERRGYVDTRCGVIAARHDIDLSEHAARSMAEIFVSDGYHVDFLSRFNIPYRVQNEQLIVVADRSHYFVEAEFESSLIGLIPAFRLFEAGALTSDHFWKVICSEPLDTLGSSVNGLQAILSTIEINR